MYFLCTRIKNEINYPKFKPVVIAVVKKFWLVLYAWTGN